LIFYPESPCPILSRSDKFPTLAAELFSIQISFLTKPCFSIMHTMDLTTGQPEILDTPVSAPHAAQFDPEDEFGDEETADFEDDEFSEEEFGLDEEDFDNDSDLDEEGFDEGFEDDLDFGEEEEFGEEPFDEDM